MRISTFMRNETISSAEQGAVSPLTAEIRALLQQCKHLSQNMKILRPGRFLSCPEPIVSSPDMADHLVDLYQSHMEPAFRILHRPSFKNELERYKAAPADTSDATMLQIQLAIAIGSGLCPELSSSKDTHMAACQWVYAAQDWLSGPMEKNRLSMDGVQVHCLLILARQVLSVSGDLSWVAMGMLLRTALQLGLHRDPKNFPGMSVFEAEMRRRLWATILELNAQASLDSGTLPGISYDDFDTGPPANINDEDIDEDSTTLKQHDGTTKTDGSLQRFLLQSLPPRLEMLRKMNGLATNLGDEKTLALSAKFSEACREVDAHVRANSNGQAPTFNRNMASLLIRRFLLVLHRPLAGRIRENALYYHSRKVSFDSAMALLKPHTPNEAFTYLMLRGGGLFKSCMIHGSLALGSELLIETEEQGSGTYRQMLIDAVKEARQQWVQRMQLGDTNVRIHMKLCIVLNLAEVTGEEGSQMQQRRMAQSAKDSLELCHGLIRENFGASTATSSSGCDEWSGQSFHMDRDNEQSSLSSYSISLGDILQINGSDMDGAFGSNIPLL
ncbi:fungal-specific transcription factor domain-containing protein [Xylaria sp. FL0064]|nr:fungal-specific transcription factor domain-containing protein [Xylaria sp. FL0064]